MTSLLLLSGGMDSIALMWLVRPDAAVTIDYGQVPAAAEIQASAAAAKEAGVPHNVVQADCSALGSGDLAGREPSSHAPAADWWPFRNQLLATLAAPLALSLGCKSMLFGAVSGDEQHRDGQLEFFRLLSAAMVFQEGGLTLDAPAAHLTTSELIEASGVPKSVLAWAHSCHVSNAACGTCRGCSKHYSVTQAYAEVAY